jgi:hypothetical protein
MTTAYPSARLTDEFIHRLPFTPKGQAKIRDEECRGLLVVIGMETKTLSAKVERLVSSDLRQSFKTISVECGVGKLEAKIFMNHKVDRDVHDGYTTMPSSRGARDLYAKPQLRPRTTGVRESAYQSFGSFDPTVPTMWE